MKNLLIYINPRNKKFSPEHDDLTKIQIDNSLALGWHTKDIILVTNFPWEYKEVKATVVGDYTVFDADRSTKIPAINELFARELISDQETYWFHDHDAFQLAPFNVKMEKDAGFTTHGYQELWNAGSFFFKKRGRDIFQDIWHYMNLRGTNEQNALTYMWQNNINNINDHYTLMNQTYNIGIYHLDKIIAMAEKPIKVAHFHPHKRRHLELFKQRNLLSKELLEIFSQHNVSI